jgi:hypothetical protein
MLRLRLLGLLLVLAVASPAWAAPRLTMRLENVTLHETLRQLQAFYGLRITAADGAGTGAYAEPAGAARSSFQWQGAGIGSVLRDVGAQFSQRVTTRADGSLFLQPGTPPEPGLTLNREGVVITLRRVRQSESRFRAASASQSEVRRSLQLSLEIHPTEGDPDLLYGVENLRARDEAGRELPPAASQRRPSGLAPGGFPDEWPVTASFGGFEPGSRLLSAIQGEVVLYREAATHRVEVPIPDQKPGGEWAAGPARLRLPATEANGLTHFFLAWPREVEIDGGSAGSSAGVNLLARGRDGRLTRLPISFGGLSVDEHGEHSAEFTLRTPQAAQGSSALVWDITTHSRPERRVPFQFVQVPLPLSDSAGAAAGHSTLLLDVPETVSSQAGQLTVGYARQQGQAWGATRWTTLDTDDRGEALLDGLSPGNYRLQVTFRPRDGRGNLAGAVALKTAAPSVVIATGKTVRLELQRR